MRNNTELRILVWNHLKALLEYKEVKHTPLPYLRITTKEWANMLLENEDKHYSINGYVYNAQAVSIGSGIQSILLEDNKLREIL